MWIFVDLDLSAFLLIKTSDHCVLENYERGCLLREPFHVSRLLLTLTAVINNYSINPFKLILGDPGCSLGPKFRKHVTVLAVGLLKETGLHVGRVRPVLDYESTGLMNLALNWC